MEWGTVRMETTTLRDPIWEISFYYDPSSFIPIAYTQKAKKKVESEAYAEAKQKLTDKKARFVQYTFKEIRLEPWSGTMFSGMLTILILFIVSSDIIKNTALALYLTFLYALLAMLLSNGLFIAPQATLQPDPPTTTKP